MSHDFGRSYGGDLQAHRVQGPGNSKWLALRSEGLKHQDFVHISCDFVWGSFEEIFLLNSFDVSDHDHQKQKNHVQ